MDSIGSSWWTPRTPACRDRAAWDDRGMPMTASDVTSGSLPDGLEQLIPSYLGGQRWFAGTETPNPDSVHVERSRELWAGDGDGPRLWQAIVGVAGVRYQL